MLCALVECVENGKAPDKIIATAFDCGIIKNDISFQRPIYPYPKFPEYMSGDPSIPSSYQGVEHQRGHVSKPADRYQIGICLWWIINCEMNLSWLQVFLALLLWVIPKYYYHNNT